MNAVLDQLPPPGEDSHVNRPGHWSSYLAAALGAFLAAFVDLLHNGGDVDSRNALVLRISDVIRNHFDPELGGSLPAVLLVTTAGLVLCWLWSPSTRRDAFALGLSVFALFSAASPYSTTRQTQQPQALAEAVSGVLELLLPTSHAQSPSTSSRLATVDYLLSFRFEDRNAARGEIRIEILDRSGDRAPQALLVPATQPVRLQLPKGEYVVNAECDGCARSRIFLKVHKPLEATEVVFGSSRWPLSLQRLAQPRAVTTRDLSDREAKSLLASFTQPPDTTTANP